MSTHCRIAQRGVVPDDPHDCTDAPDQLSLLRALCGTLVRRSGTGHVPALAAGWQVDRAARAWRFDLRPGLMFHDGTPCDGAAVVACLRRMARADKGYALGSPGVWRQYLGGARLTAPDAATVLIDLPEPVADLLDVLEQGFLVSPAVLEAWDRGARAPLAGAGPYRIAQAGPERLRALRVPGHPAPARFGEITWIAAPDRAAREALLLEGAVEVAADIAPEGPGGAEITRHAYLSPVAIIALLNSAAGPLTDGRVRRALSLAVDRDALVADVMNGLARPLHGFVSPVHFGADGAAPVPHDPALARELLAQAGHGAGLVLHMDCPTRLPDEAEALCAALRAQLAAVGITLEIHIHPDREAYAHMVRRKEIRDLCVFDSSPMSTFRVLHEKIDARVAGAWWQGYRNPQVEALLDAGRAETERDARGAFYARAYAELQADPPWLTCYNATRAVGLRAPVEGFVMPPDGILDVSDL